MKKVLWINPSFLDYRIPLYGELNRKLKGQFHLLYSRERIPERCHKRVGDVLGENAHYIDKEKQIKFGKPSAEFANTSVSIPFPAGLYSKIKGVKPDVIIAEGFFQFTPWAVVYSFLHRIPLYIAYERTAHTERNCPAWRKLYRKFIGWFVNGYIVNGCLTKEYLMSQGAKAENITTGGMCADSEELRLKSSKITKNEKRSFEENIGLKGKKGLRFIYVGQIIQRKGVEHLLFAWRKHITQYPDDELLIVGEGPLLNEYKRNYYDIKSIRFIGGVDYSTIYQYYSISDVFIIPTLEDNWSLVVPEAMACGLPIACSIYNGCHPELVHNGINGTTFDPIREDSVMEVLAYFHDKDLISMGEKSIEIEEQYTTSKVADNIISALKN